MNRTERRLVVRDLPAFVDLLLVGVEMGWSFDQAVAYINEHFRSPVTVLLRQTYAAIAAGESRHEALRSLSERCAIPEFSGLLNTILVT